MIRAVILTEYRWGVNGHERFSQGKPPRVESVSALIRTAEKPKGERKVEESWGCLSLNLGNGSTTVILPAMRGGEFETERASEQLWQCIEGVGREL